MKLQIVLTRQKHYKVVIYSKDVKSGTMHDGVYELSLPDHVVDNNNYHTAVEHFAHNGDVVGSLPSSRVIIPELSLSQPDTYNTSSQTNTRALCVLPRSATTSVPVSFSQTITSKTYGIPLADTTFLRTKELRVTMKAMNDFVHTDASLGSSASWVMVLVVYPFEK
jgi:hypothetical protein